VASKRAAVVDGDIESGADDLPAALQMRGSALPGLSVTPVVGLPLSVSAANRLSMTVGDAKGGAAVEAPSVGVASGSVAGDG
jgi:hypothetical protein